MHQISLRELFKDAANQCQGVRTSGKILAVKGNVVVASLPLAKIGDACSIISKNNKKIKAQVINFNGKFVNIAAYEDLKGISSCDTVESLGNTLEITIPDNTFGLVIDSMASILKINGEIKHDKRSISLPLYRPAPPALLRLPNNQIIPTGIRSIDTLCTLAYGQRIGLFAGPGLGKSTLLGMLARNSEVDLTIIALVGERGREVNDFITRVLGVEGLRKSIVVVETSEQTALRRTLAPITATTIAEHYRAKGLNVLLLVDSLTRMARAIRDVSLASGETPIRQGFTPSVFSELPKLIERAGNDANGSITAIYTLLDTSEHELDPLAEEAKSLLDGHISLDSTVALSGIRPAIDFTRSISRLNNLLHKKDYLKNQSYIIKMISRLKRDKDLVLLGGSADTELERFIKYEPELINFLNQHEDEKINLMQSLSDFTTLHTGVYT